MGGPGEDVQRGVATYHYSAMKKLMYVLMVALVMGCGIGMKVVTVRSYGPIAVHEPFALLEEDDTLDTARAELVARIRTTDKGMTVRCDYPAVLDTLKALARSMGANLVKIDRHMLPSVYGSSCHRVEARFFRVEDATPFEETITWHPERRLRLVDFKGDTAARPFRAATFCGITYHGNYAANKMMVTVEAWFDNQGSYFKHGDDDPGVLAHEQVHFDIAEVYARMLRKRIDETSFIGRDFNSVLHDLHMAVMREMSVEQDRYDASVYADPAMQPSWSDSVAGRLADLDPFRSHTVTVRFR